MTGICVPGAPLHLQTNTPKPMHINTLLEPISLILFDKFLSCSLPYKLKHTGSKNPPKPSTRLRPMGWGSKGDTKGGRRGVVVCRGVHSLADNLTSKAHSISVNKSLVLGGSCWQQINNVRCTLSLSWKWKHSNRWQQTSLCLRHNL